MKKTSKRTLTALMAAMILATTSVVAAIPVFAAETQSVSSEQQTASVAIDEKNFPDERFRQFVKTQFDTDGDGIFSAEEIAQIKGLVIQYDKESGIKSESFSALDYTYKNDRDSYDGITMDFTGLEHFSSLTYLGIKNIEASNLDLEKLPNLELVNFAAMPKTAFDFTNCKALQEIGIMNTPLEYLRANKANLTYLLAPNCELKEIDLSQGTWLYDIVLCDNQLTDIKLPKGNMSGEFWDFANNQLTNLDLSETFPETIDISGNPFTEINSETLKADGAVISRMNATNLAQCRSFDVSHMRGLQDLSAGPRLAESIKIRNQLRELFLYDLDHISVIDKTTIQAPADNMLEWLEVNDCTLTKLSTSQFSNLHTLRATGNQLQHLNISGNTELVNLSLWDNKSGGNEELKTMIANRSIGSSCVTELQKVAKQTGGKITYIPEKITGLKAIKKTKTTLKLTFNAVSGVSGYKIYDAATGKVLANVSTQKGAKKLVKTITGLKAGEQRKYKVRGYVTVNGTKHYGAYSNIYTKSTAN